MGYVPKLLTVRSFVTAQWKHVETPTVLAHDSGWFVFHFQNAGARDIILKDGPWTVASRALMLKQWTPEFRFDKEDMARVPVWVNLTNLDLHHWSAPALSKIASLIGTPLYADKCPGKKEKVSYAQVLIEVDVRKQLPCEVPVLGVGGEEDYAASIL